MMNLVDEHYQLLLITLVARRTFFNELRALLRYMLFDNWTHLMHFMLTGLEMLPGA